MLLKVVSFSGSGENTMQNEILFNGDRMYEKVEQPDLDSNKNSFENNHNADNESYSCLDDLTINHSNNLIIEAACSDLIFLDDMQIISVPVINENKKFTEATDPDKITDTQEEMPDPSARDNTQLTNSMSIPNDRSTTINQENNDHHSYCVETSGSSEYSSYKESDGSEKRSRKRKKDEANWKKNIVNAYEQWNGISVCQRKYSCSKGVSIF